MSVASVAPESASTPAHASRHLLLPFAAASDPACQQALAQLQLPNLEKLLARLHPHPLHTGDDYSLTPPHERALAQALGWATLPDGALPWAAWHAGERERACAWFTPCHWNVGMEQVSLLPPDGLGLSETHSHALLQALYPFCEEDGITLVFEAPGRWRAEGSVLADLRCASLDRVAHRRVDAWLLNTQQSPHASLLLRLQNEAQMLFYTHPVNDERSAQGLPTINGFWISGAGRLPPAPTSATELPLQPDTLRQAALRGDWTAWTQAWQALDASDIRHWLARAEQGEAVQLTLCGERQHQTWSTLPPAGTATPPAWRRWLGRWLERRPTVAQTLAAL